MSLVRVVRLAIVVAAAVVVGIAAAFAVALVGHEILVALYGEDLAYIDDTLPMIVAVWTAYLVGVVSALAVIVLGRRRFVRRAPGSRPRDTE